MSAVNCRVHHQLADYFFSTVLLQMFRWCANSAGFAAAQADNYSYFRSPVARPPQLHPRFPFFAEGSYLQFMSDEFLRLLLCRHVFASVVLRVHRSFRSRPKNHPTTHPPLPDLDVVENPTLQRYTLDLALQGRGRRTVLRRGKIHF